MSSFVDLHVVHVERPSPAELCVLAERFVRFYKEISPTRTLTTKRSLKGGNKSESYDVYQLLWYIWKQSKVSLLNLHLGSIHEYTFSSMHERSVRHPPKKSAASAQTHKCPIIIVDHTYINPICSTLACTC